MRRYLIWMGTAITVLAAVTVAIPASITAPIYTAAHNLKDSAGGTEPRVFVASDDRRWLITNVKDDTVAVFGSSDKGRTWTRTATDPVGQTIPTIDVDVVVLPTGRIIATELDIKGINFPTAYSDDDGKTWTASKGAQELVDQDRQWLAVGPKDSATGEYRVYMLYHNLASGFAQHNMWVMTSTDSGETFGLPIPTTLPGQQAYMDLQCADSGGPGSISVDPKTGRLYAVFGTRSAGPTGGCGAQPLEVNIVAATRVWVATSPDNAPGSWTQSIAVDNSTNGKIVGMQVSPGTLDSKGNLWVVYPESPRPYPDYTGAAIKLVWAPPDLSRWSEPITLVESGGVGSLTPHIVAGDPGRIAVAYYRGAQRAGKKPVWFTHVATTPNAFAAKPLVIDQRLSNIPAYTGTASEMMGACSGETPTAGVQNGFACDRATDIWGMALDSDGHATVTWPTIANDAGGAKAGTYVATQIGGMSLNAPAATAPRKAKPAIVKGVKRDQLPATGVGGGLPAAVAALLTAAGAAWTLRKRRDPA